MEIFNNNQVFLSENSFKQNNIIKKELRYDVNNYINSNLNNNVNFNNLICIGGESYLFGITNDNIKYIHHYTNSIHIYNDANKNNFIYRKILNNNIINYNTFTYICSGDILIINIAKLNINLLNIINKRFYQKIIIINCHHIEFWKRIKLLSNYKLILRKQYISNLYFVTVNILEYKYKLPIFIPLGTSCAVAYQLNKLGLRKESYPFDWAKFSINKINNVLENNFDSFSNLNIKKFSDKHIHKDYYINSSKYTNISGSYILYNKYNIQFAHELLINNNINNLKEKFNDRIKRFYNTSKFIYFIILDINHKQYKNHYIQKLIYNLDKIFTSYKILYISNTKVTENNKIKYIYAENKFIDWKYSNMDWFSLIYENI